MTAHDRERIMKILTYPNDTLRQVSITIDKVTQSTRDIVDDMLETMYRADGVGLTAVQIGVLEKLVVIDVEDVFQVLVNPKVVATSEDTNIMVEGCLSVPETRVQIERSTGVEVKGESLDGGTVMLNKEGLIARVLQHEIDHLNGKLIIDYLPRVIRESYKAG